MVLIQRARHFIQSSRRRA